MNRLDDVERGEDSKVFEVLCKSLVALELEYIEPERDAPEDEVIGRAVREAAGATAEATAGVAICYVNSN